MSARPTEEISLEERRYENGEDPRVLDKIRIHFLEPRPRRHQQENHLIDADSYWELRGSVSWEEIGDAVEEQSQLWPDAGSSSNGVNDQVPETQIEKLTNSLHLIRPERLKILVALEGGGPWGPPRRRVRADFYLGKHYYRLAVTDPVAENYYFSQENGVYQLPDAILCVSLSDVYEKTQCAYKLVATVITPGSAKR